MKCKTIYSDLPGHHYEELYGGLRQENAGLKAMDKCDFYFSKICQ